MNGRHATPRELEWYVIGALDPAWVAFVERHASTCRSCAAGLANEARLEVAFEQIAERASSARVAHGAGGNTRRGERECVALAEHSWKGAGYGVFGVVAMAAATLLWLGRPVSSASAAGDGPTAGRGGRGAIGDGAAEARADVRDGG